MKEVREQEDGKLGRRSSSKDCGIRTYVRSVSISYLRAGAIFFVGGAILLL